MALAKRFYQCRIHFEVGDYVDDRFREHRREVEKDEKKHLNRLLDALICQIIPSNIWQSAASPFIKEAKKAAKL